jgi:ubiquitin-protein ligase
MEDSTVNNSINSESSMGILLDQQGPKISDPPISDKFDLITKSISKTFIKKRILHIIFKRNNKDNSLSLQLIYKKNTDFNPMSYDLAFSLSLDADYPKSIPQVKALTHFSFPTVFDNRNLIFSVINHNWVNKNNLKDLKDLREGNLVEPIEEIILSIPKFLSRLIENTNNKILVYYGDYKIDMIYDINDFLVNTDLDFFKVCQHLKPKKEGEEKVKKERYVVLTDIYFLLFDAVPHSKNLAKLLFWGDIRQIVTCKGTSFSSESDSETLILEWKNNNKLIQFEMSFTNGNIKFFLDKSTRKILRLKEQYKIFQDDMSKPVEDEIVSRMKDVNLSSSNIDKLIMLVKYKEEILERKHSINIIRELMSLYQKIIEILSAKGDLEFKTYLDKLHKMLTDKQIQEELEKEKIMNSADSKKIFELSNFYSGSDEDGDYDDRYDE